MRLISVVAFFCYLFFVTKHNKKQVTKIVKYVLFILTIRAVVADTTTGNQEIEMNIEKFMSCKGQFIAASWLSPKTPAAAFKGHRLEKRSSGLFRAGISFSNLGSVKDAIEAGEREEVGPLPWGEWMVYPYTIGHKGATYFRLTPPSMTIYYVDGLECDKDVWEQAPEILRSSRSVPDWSSLVTRYFVDAVEVAKETFDGFLTPSDAKDGPMPSCITVKQENFLTLGEPDPDRDRRRAA